MGQFFSTFKTMKCWSYTQTLLVVVSIVAYSEAAPRAIDEASDAWYNYFGHGQPWKHYGYPQRYWKNIEKAEFVPKDAAVDAWNNHFGQPQENNFPQKFQKPTALHEYYGHP